MTELEQRQLELKKWIKKIFKSQKYFAEQYFIETHVNYDEEDLKQFYERFKKTLARSTTDIVVIDKYLTFLFDSQEFKDSEYIKPRFFYADNFDQTFNLRMQEISKKITKKMIAQDETNENV